MTTPKHRALQALADAKDRPFLAAAPLMAIVEAVAVLDEAGLLGESSMSDAGQARALLADEGFPGQSIEAQVRALIREWSEEREMARTLRAAAQVETGKAQLLRDAAEGVNTYGLGSREAVAYGVRTLGWVKFCEWRTDRDGVKRTMVIGTFDENGMDDAQRNELQAVLDSHRCAGARILMEVDGISFMHPAAVPCALSEPNMVGATVEPCPDCGAEANEAHSGDCEALPPGSCKDCGVPPAHAHLPGCDNVAPMTADAPRTHCSRCDEPMDDGRTCTNFPACPNATLPF